MTDAERAMAWNALVASFPGETHKDKLLSLLIYTARELTPVGTTIRSLRVTATLNTGVVVDVMSAENDR